MGFTRSLPLLLLLRVVQGFAAGTSTIGLILVSATSSKETLSPDIGFFQASMTLGQLLGPLFGSMGVVALGYRGAFLAASAVLFMAFVFASIFVPNVAPLPRKEGSSGRITVEKQILVAWVVSFMAMVQLMFLPSVLPNVFESFHIRHAVALKSAGMVVMLYTGTAMIGIYFWSRVSRKYGLIRMVTFLFTVGILTQILLALVDGIVSFTLIRMLQTGMVAATFPLVISIFAAESKGGIIGFLNSARFAGNALGPILATSILAWSNLPFLFLSIACLDLIVVLVFRIFFREKGAHSPAEA